MGEPRIVQGPPPGARARIDPERAGRHYTRTDHTWTPRTYADELSERGEDPRVRARCDCGRVRPACAIIDARGLPPEIRGEREWACDACKTTWVYDPRNPLADRAELVEHLGGPAVVAERVRAAEAWRFRDRSGAT